MKVKELIEILQGLDQEKDIPFIVNERGIYNIDWIKILSE